MQITFEQMPAAIGQLSDRLENIERLLSQIEKAGNTQSSDDLMIIKQAAEFIHLSLPTVYGLVSNRKIPFMKKGKRLYFSKKELTQWLQGTKRGAIA